MHSIHACPIHAASPNNRLDKTLLKTGGCLDRPFCYEMKFIINKKVKIISNIFLIFIILLLILSCNNSAEKNNDASNSNEHMTNEQSSSCHFGQTPEEWKSNCKNLVNSVPVDQCHVIKSPLDCFYYQCDTLYICAMSCLEATEECLSYETCFYGCSVYLDEKLNE